MTRPTARSAGNADDRSRRRATPREDEPARAQAPRAPLEIALDTAGLKIISLDDYAGEGHLPTVDPDHSSH